MRKTLIALALAFATGVVAPALAQSAAPVQPGQRVQLGPMVGERVVREVMISQGGGGLTVVYDMAPGQPESKRVLRLDVAVPTGHDGNRGWELRATASNLAGRFWQEPADVTRARTGPVPSTLFAWPVR